MYTQIERCLNTQIATDLAGDVTKIGHVPYRATMNTTLLGRLVTIPTSALQVRHWIPTAQATAKVTIHITWGLGTLLRSTARLTTPPAQCRNSGSEQT